ncbi:hypothetical protein FB567DRAFT_612331 [Paraphoma chrysanthemicola]|uniref:Uncharacterized protein n=1 Tax=Paraphoma chrysanthemicola TaxID=798071 RepID=A0A8K0QV99_9PLEO|nr:hypothetical protein FB567DRAFT_612331 [Paraphoma chrysanthemicola]
MPKQTAMVSRKNKRGKSNARGGARNSTAATPRNQARNDSVTPAPDTLSFGPGPRLKLNLNTTGSESTPQQVILDESQVEEDGVPVVGIEEQQREADSPLPSPRRTRAGRVTKPKRYDDFALGSELEEHLDMSSTKMDDEDYLHLPSSPPTTTVLSVHGQRQARRQGPGRPRKEEVEADRDQLQLTSSSTIAPSSSPPVPINIALEPDVETIAQSVTSSDKIAIELPQLTDAAEGKEKPYSAEMLTQLYIVGYKSKQWNLCDLVADTWIRAFHARRRREARQGKRELALWRPNKALNSRPRGYAQPKEYGAKLKTEDPELEEGVTAFNHDMLQMLYANTAPDCGARLLWADSMALGGSRLEHMLTKKNERNGKWHTELVYNVMLTGLRMCRRTLTLKIEESAEGAWCKRYHEHTKHGRRCYREIAAMETPDEDEDEEDEDDLADALTQQMVQGGMWNDDGPGKHVRFSGFEDREMVDLDAEGESEVE